MSQATATHQSAHHRTRHWAWREAHERTKQCAFGDSPDFYEDAWGQGPEIERLSEIYQRDVHDSAIVLANECDDRVLVLPYFTRFSSEYYPEKAREIQRLVWFQTALFLTLTLNPNLFSSLFAAKNGLLKGWSKLRNVMKKNAVRRTGRVVGWLGNYLAVLEFQASGNPHLHIVLPEASWIDVDWLRWLWEEKYQLGTFVHVERVENNRKRVVSYILKYLFKARDNQRHLALLWALNARAYNRSRNIFNNKKTNCDKVGGVSECQWFLVGIFPLDRCKDFKTLADLETFLDT